MARTRRIKRLQTTGYGLPILYDGAARSCGLNRLKPVVCGLSTIALTQQKVESHSNFEMSNNLKKSNKDSFLSRIIP
jgi:hypothetical protein